jgi:hypothetical protein
MARSLKPNGPGAADTALRAKNVPLHKRTSSHNPVKPSGANGKKRQALSAVGPDGPFVVRGQMAKTLRALVAAGDRGATAQEVSSWAFRLGGYVYFLRHVHGLVIELQREPHEGGWHGRYVLRSNVTITTVRLEGDRA